MWSKFQSTKWLLTVFVEINATVMTYLDLLSGGEWVSISTVVLGGYTIANMVGDKLPNKGWSDER